MAKFYVQCGPIQVVLTAASAEQAALAALDRSLHAHVWIYDDAGLTIEDCRTHLMLEALLHLDPTIRVSQQGFDRHDALLIGTPEMVDHWHQLMVGMSRLFLAAGLTPRKMTAVVGAATDRQPMPRKAR